MTFVVVVVVVVVVVPRSGWIISRPDRAKFGVGPCGAGAEIQNSASQTFCPWNLGFWKYWHHTDGRTDRRTYIWPVLHLQVIPGEITKTSITGVSHLE